MRLSWVRTLGLPVTLVLLSAATLLGADGAGAGGAAYLQLATGARPMGMGGAFTGLADDATAIYFNVAGISTFQKREALAMHAGLSFDRNFNHVAAVFPNHCGESAWGLSLTRFSVDGIPETRVDAGGNPLLNGDGTVTIFSLFDDVEANGTVSYAWTHSDKVRLGATARLFHDKMYHDEANGFGLDLGALFQPTQDVRVGLSVKNMFGSLRWNGESNLGRQHRDRVSLDAAAGVAVRGWKDVLYLLDVFWLEGDHVGLRAGAEKWWADHYALRTGLNDGHFTAGASARYQQFQFDYAFQFEDFSDINRVSLTYRW